MKTLFSTPNICISRPAMVDPTSLYLLTYDGLCFVRDGETKIIYPFSDQISPFRTVIDTTNYRLNGAFQPPVWKNDRILFGAIEKQTDGSIAHKLKIVTPEGELFVMALNVFLVIGIVVVGYSLFRQFFRYTAAKTMRDTHCPQCYSKVDRDAEFCPVCGRRLDHRRLQR